MRRCSCWYLFIHRCAKILQFLLFLKTHSSSFHFPFLFVRGALKILKLRLQEKTTFQNCWIWIRKNLKESPWGISFSEASHKEKAVGSGLWLFWWQYSVMGQLTVVYFNLSLLDFVLSCKLRNNFRSRENDWTAMVNILFTAFLKGQKYRIRYIEFYKMILTTFFRYKKYISSQLFRI